MTQHITDILIRNDVSKDITDHLNTLTMRPGDWRDLDKILGRNDYRDVVNDYQCRQQQNLPDCVSLFKVCIYSHGGKCNCKGHCPFKRG